MLGTLDMAGRPTARTASRPCARLGAAILLLLAVLFAATALSGPARAADIPFAFESYDFLLPPVDPPRYPFAGTNVAPRIDPGVRC